MNQEKIKILITSLFLTFFVFFLDKYTFLTGRVVYKEYYVTKIIDGDTIEISNGERVRLLGINSPEKGRYFYDESKKYLENTVLNKRVKIEFDSLRKDSYGRLLAFVFVDDKNLNLDVVEKGLAHTFRLREISKYKKELIEAEKHARENELGIWKKSNYSKCVILRDFVFAGREKLALENICDFSINLDSWAIEDESHNYLVFNDFVLNKGETKVVCITTDSNCDYTFNRSFPIFDKEGDKVFLRDRQGFLVFFYEY